MQIKMKTTSLFVMFIMLVFSFTSYAQVRQSKIAVIAILDTGVDYNHPLLRDKIWPSGRILNQQYCEDCCIIGPSEPEWVNFAYDETGFGTGMDYYGHGTHVAGIATRTCKAAEPLVTDVKILILPVKMMVKEIGEDKASGSKEWIIRAVRDVIAFRKETKLPVVINASWVWGGYSVPEELSKAIKDSGEAGILWVAAAGNDFKSSPSYPASITDDYVISVAALHKDGDFGEFSNRGADISAPGIRIESLVPNKEGYVEMSGTSMAAPDVASIAALVYGAHPEWKPGQVKQAILESADLDPFLKNTVKGGRKLNAAKALAYKP